MKMFLQKFKNIEVNLGMKKIRGAPITMQKSIVIYWDTISGGRHPIASVLTRKRRAERINMIVSIRASPKNF